MGGGDSELDKEKISNRTLSELSVIFIACNYLVYICFFSFQMLFCLICFLDTSCILIMGGSGSTRVYISDNIIQIKPSLGTGKSTHFAR